MNLIMNKRSIKKNKNAKIIDKSIFNEIKK